MLVAAAFAPHPPLIVPDLAAGAAGDLDDLRSACDAAVGRLLAAAPDLVAVVGAGPAVAWWDESAVGTLAGYGVPLTVPLRAGSGVLAPGGARMPLSATIGAWLLGRVGYAGPRRAVTVPAAVTGRDLAGLAAELAGVGRLGLLVMGDGSARRCVAAPGYVDPRAEGFDASVAAALAVADADRLRSLDPALGADLLAAGVPAWRLAGDVAAGAGPLSGDLLYDDAPYGVGYFVAAWESVSRRASEHRRRGAVRLPCPGRDRCAEERSESGGER